MDTIDQDVVAQQVAADLAAKRSEYRPTRLQVCLHARHQAQRDNLIAALESMSGLRWLKQAQRVRECASYGRMYVRGSRTAGSVGLWVHRCGHRCCPFCARRRSARVAQEIREYMAHVSKPRHIVLTRRHDTLSLPDQIRTLRNAFRRLRLSAWGRQRIRGGVYVVEVKMGADGRWHPHLHVLYDGLFIAQAELSARWAAHTDGSPVVWINAARSAAARYLAKYVGKPADLAGLSVERLAEYIEGVHGLRMVQPFGAAHGPRPRDGDTPDPQPDSTCSVTFGVVARAAAAGHLGAQALLRATAYRYPVLASYARAYVDLWPRPPDYGSQDWRDRADAEISRCLKFVWALVNNNDGR